ncbi:hypothetical protein CEXT_343081 [Caerostris extrusa]|uniref:Uncharacterized protein n=1 Tax=Caerostris extrusa TaxID=172846 RepID=A0AAV4SCA1_CAEEX|nr:hypothetical protein CEXT_343081 [Caerostris extrusa]
MENKEGREAPIATSETDCRIKSSLCNSLKWWPLVMIFFPLSLSAFLGATEYPRFPDHPSRGDDCAEAILVDRFGNCVAHKHNKMVGESLERMYSFYSDVACNKLADETRGGSANTKPLDLYGVAGAFMDVVFRCCSFHPAWTGCDEFLLNSQQALWRWQNAVSCSHTIA